MDDTAWNKGMEALRKLVLGESAPSTIEQDDRHAFESELRARELARRRFAWQRHLEQIQAAQA